jgi:periplasmic divalent cation tolerance protein
MLMLGWTTVGKIEDAQRLARGMVERRLAACVQIEGALRSLYVWENKMEESEEYRLLVKFIPARGRELEKWLTEHHPYETPEWVVVRAEHVSEKYLSWARANCTSRPL